MSVEAISWALKQTAGDSVGKLLLITLANYADDEGRAWPAQAKLAAQCEVSIDTVQRRLARLERRGLLKRERRRREGGGWSTSAVTLLIDHTAQSAVRRTAKPAARDTADPAARDTATVRQQEPSLYPSTEKKKKNTQEARAHAISIPEDFEPDMIEAQRLGLSLEEAAIAGERFLDHHRAKGTTSGDWPAAWRTWCRIAVDRRQHDQRRENGGGAPRKRDSWAQQFREARAEIDLEEIIRNRGNWNHDERTTGRAEHGRGAAIEIEGTRCS